MKKKFDVPLEEIKDYYIRLDNLLKEENIPPAFVYNVDESGFQEFVDSINQTVIVPADAEDEKFYYAVNRTTKRASLIGCICLDGSALMPCIISSNKTVEQELINLGYNSSNCLLVSQENNFVNAEIFAYWADDIFFPNVVQKIEDLNYHDLVLLLLDGWQQSFRFVFS